MKNFQPKMENNHYATGQLTSEEDLARANIYENAAKKYENSKIPSLVSDDIDTHDNDGDLFVKRADNYNAERSKVDNSKNKPLDFVNTQEKQSIRNNKRYENDMSEAA
ncbi:MAG: hypothetical protein WCG01_00385 [bacterium]